MITGNTIFATSLDSIDFSVFNGDLTLPFYGGNKSRKFSYIENIIAENNCNAIVTTGGIQSNHCRVAALLSASKGWKCILVLHGSKGEYYSQKGNALLMRLADAEVRFVNSSQIGVEMDNAMHDLVLKGYKPYYVYGGGHNSAGVKAYIDAVVNLWRNTPAYSMPDHIFLASGTGSTQAGIILGLKKIGYQNIKVHGISVARNKEAGLTGITEAINMVNKSDLKNDLLFYDEYLFGGYSIYNNNLLNFTVKVANETGIILDPTYTGKAFYGMLDIVTKQKLKGNILFWHTGGLLNLMA